MLILKSLNGSFLPASSLKKKNQPAQWHLGGAVTPFKNTKSHMPFMKGHNSAQEIFCHMYLGFYVEHRRCCMVKS